MVGDAERRVVIAQQVEDRILDTSSDDEIRTRSDGLSERLRDIASARSVVSAVASKFGGN